ncbi:MAG: hypothetical protein ACKPEY_06620 [Planctomycetota bacterium]
MTRQATTVKSSDDEGDDGEGEYKEGEDTEGSSGFKQQRVQTPAALLVATS